MQDTFFASMTISCILSWLGETTAGGLVGSSLLATKDGIYNIETVYRLCCWYWPARSRFSDLKSIIQAAYFLKGWKMQSTTKMNRVFAKLYQEVYHRKWKFLNTSRIPTTLWNHKGLNSDGHGCWGTVWKEIKEWFFFDCEATRPLIIIRKSKMVGLSGLWWNRMLSFPLLSWKNNQLP